MNELIKVTLHVKGTLMTGFIGLAAAHEIDEFFKYGISGSTREYIDIEMHATSNSGVSQIIRLRKLSIDAIVRHVPNLAKERADRMVAG